MRTLRGWKKSLWLLWLLCESCSEDRRIKGLISRPRNSNLTVVVVVGVYKFSSARRSTSRGSLKSELTGDKALDELVVVVVVEVVCEYTND